MKFLLLLFLAVVLIAGCTQSNSQGASSTFTVPIPDKASLCKGTARCFNGTVTRIVDGDTLEADDVPIRLALVDAPDYNEEGWNETRNFVLNICPIGSKAIVDEDDGQNESYGRIVAVVYCKITNLNAVLLSTGKATLYEEFCNVSEFANEEWVKKYGC